MRRFCATIVITALSFFLYSCKKNSVINPEIPIVITPPAPLDFYLIGYFPTYRDINSTPDQIFRMYNIVNYAFLNTNASGTLDEVDLSNYNPIYNKAKNSGAKVFLSINNAANLKIMAATAAGRLNFIIDLMDKVRQLKADGVDIDWEFPSTFDGTDATYAALMQQLSDSLHAGGKYYLSAAITPGKYPGSIRDGIRSEVFNYVDFFNVMIYDDFSITQPYMQHAGMPFFNASLNYWLNTRSMPSKKFVAGIPAYGRPSGITQTNTVLSYNYILHLGGSPLLDSAKVSAGGFSDYTIYYNGQPTVKKKAAMVRQQAGGIMLWEIGEDATNNNSLIKAVNDTLGRSY